MSLTELLASLEPGERVELVRSDDGRTFSVRVERVASRGGPIVHRRHSFTEASISAARFDVAEHVLAKPVCDCNG